MLLRKNSIKNDSTRQTKLLYWLALLVVISTSNNHLVYAVYTALILLTAADGWLGTALAGGMSFGLLWSANALLPGTVFSFMLVLFPRIIAVGISMRTMIDEMKPAAPWRHCVTCTCRSG